MMCLTHDQELKSLCCGAGESAGEGFCASCHDHASFVCESCENEAAMGGTMPGIEVAL